MVRIGFQTLVLWVKWLAPPLSIGPTIHSISSTLISTFALNFLSLDIGRKLDMVLFMGIQQQKWMAKINSEGGYIPVSSKYYTYNSKYFFPG